MSRTKASSLRADHTGVRSITRLPARWSQMGRGWRGLVALLLIAVAATLAVVVTQTGGAVTASTNPTPPVVASPPWFAPYADVTLRTPPQFESPTANPSRGAVLGFIVAGQPHAPCTPSWGTVYTLDQASAAPAKLDARIGEAQAAGESVLVSFGGADNSELAVGCTDPKQLQSAYELVVRRYNLTTIDLDIEGSASLDPTVNARRAQAIAGLQASRQQQGKPLGVWLTLPVATSGLLADAQAVIGQMLAAGVKIAGVNVMTFAYGASTMVGQTIVTASEAALKATAAQLQALYASHRVSLGSDGAWASMGATIMEGQTATTGQVWDTASAKAFYAFALTHHIKRLSEWTLSRDRACSSQEVPVSVCSGVQQSPLEFSEILLGHRSS